MSISSWRPLGSGLNGLIEALAVGPDGSLYAGGEFTAAGNVSANFVARWDPATSSWHALGSGVGGGSNPYVYALAVGPDGSLYAGGWFTTAGGVAVNRIARWDPLTSTWYPLGSGMEGVPQPYVSSLAIAPDGSLYAAGEFATAGGAVASNIAQWKPMTSTWHSLSSGTNLKVYALAVGTDGSLYAGGLFTLAGGVPVNGIARWDGTSWHSLSNGMNGEVYALAIDSDQSLYAGGAFSTAGGAPARFIAHWNPITSLWNTLGSGMNAEVYALAMTPDELLYAGGGFSTAGGVPSTYIASWGELPPAAVTLDSFGAVADGSSTAFAWLVAAVAALALAASTTLAQRRRIIHSR